MENIIFCFSGTGNSLSAARDIKEKLGSTKIVLIADAIKEDHIELPYTRVGFVCPVYFGGNLPPIIGRFIKNLDFSHTQYVFAVVTAGAVHGGALDDFGRLIAKRGGLLNAGFSLRMPGNYIAMYGAWPAVLQRAMLKKTKKKTERITRTIKEKRITRSGDRDLTPPKPSLSERITDYHTFAKDYHVMDRCISCEICAKICPVSNIGMSEGKPLFGDTCERCMACIQWCPMNAIEYKNSTAKRKRYRNPDITASDLFPGK